MRNVRLSPFTGDDLIYRFCSDGGPSGRRAVPWADLEAQVADIPADRNPKITFAGSDPLEHDDFPRLVEACRARGLSQFRLVTDGFGLAHDAVIGFLQRNGVDEVLVVFPSANPDLYAQAMHSRNRFEACAAGLRKAAESGLETHLVVPITRLAAEGVDETLAFLKEVALSGVLVEVPETGRVGPKYRNHLLPYDQAASLVAKIFKDSRRNRRTNGVFERWLIPPCAAAGELDEYGDLFNQRYKHYRAHDADSLIRVDACAACDLSNACGGVDRAYVEAFPTEGFRAIPLEEANAWYTKPINRLEEIPFNRFSPFDSQERSGKRGLLRINGHCNMGCSFCFVDLSHPDVSEEHLFAELDKLAEHGVTELVLSGGEPTLHPSLPNVITYGKSLGFDSIELQTNGVKLANMDYAKSSADSGLDIVCISLHSHDAETSDAITKRPKAFSKTVRAIHNLRELGVWTRISHVISRLNYHEVPDFVRFARSEWPAGMLDVCFALAQEISSQTSTWVLPTFSEIKPFVKDGLDFCLDNDIKFSGFIGQGSYPPCMLDGDLRYYERVLSEVHRSPNSSDWYKAERCKECSFNEKCVGLRRSYVETYGDGEIRPF